MHSLDECRHVNKPSGTSSALLEEPRGLRSGVAAQHLRRQAEETPKGTKTRVITIQRTPHTKSMGPNQFEYNFDALSNGSSILRRYTLQLAFVKQFSKQ